MKKIIKLTLLLIFSFSFLVGCNNSKNKQGKTDKGLENKTLSKMEIISKLNEVDSALIKLWNEVICEVSWYTGSGTSSTGDALDIEFVVFNAKEYYDKVVSYKDFINNLNSEYDNIKNAYNKAVEKATIIYNEITKETPQANSDIEYEEDIDLYNQYMDYFSDAIYELD